MLHKANSFKNFITKGKERKTAVVVINIYIQLLWLRVCVENN